MALLILKEKLFLKDKINSTNLAKSILNDFFLYRLMHQKAFIRVAYGFLFRCY